MKHSILLLLLLSFITLSSCDKEQENYKIWDIYPVIISVNVVDSKGNDLLNQQTPNCLDVNKIKAIYQEQTYKCGDFISRTETRAYMPHFYGLKVDRDDYFGAYLLRFGEFDGAKSYSNETVTIFWEDGSSDKISFNRKFSSKKNGDPEISQEWFLNGSKIESGVIKITK